MEKFLVWNEPYFLQGDDVLAKIFIGAISYGIGYYLQFNFD
jgi:hypothetical protein